MASAVPAPFPPQPWMPELVRTSTWIASRTLKRMLCSAVDNTDHIKEKGETFSCDALSYKTRCRAGRTYENNFSVFVPAFQVTCFSRHAAQHKEWRSHQLRVTYALPHSISCTCFELLLSNSTIYKRNYVLQVKQ